MKGQLLSQSRCQLHHKRESQHHVSGGKFCVADCVRDCVRPGIPAPAKWQRIGIRSLTRHGLSRDESISSVQGARRSAILAPMTLMQQLSFLAQIVGAVGVLASLIFVGLQIRQNTQSQHVVAVESLAAAIAAINVPAMESPALGTALAKALKDWADASHDERVIAHYFLFSFFKLHEQAWYQYKSGVLDHTQWIGWENLIRVYYHSPGIRQVWWPSRRQAFSPQFQAYLAATEPPQAIRTLSDLFDGNAMALAHATEGANAADEKLPKPALG